MTLYFLKWNVNKLYKEFNLMNEDIILHADSM